MSLILEALRKSEAERRRAQVPDLLAEPQAAALPPAPAAQRWPWLVLPLAVLAASLWLLRAWWAPAAPVVAQAAPDAVRVRAATPALPARATVRPVRATQARPLVVAAPVPAATLARIAPPAADPGSVPATRPVAAAPTSAPATSAPATPAPVTSAPAPGAPGAPPEPVAAAPAAALPDAPMRVSDLGSEERKQLPPLKLSMHMWNEAPAQRFVIIDGTRLTIGERIGAARVADITGDGVVLDWNGRQLKLPLR